MTESTGLQRMMGGSVRIASKGMEPKHELWWTSMCAKERELPMVIESAGAFGCYFIREEVRPLGMQMQKEWEVRVRVEKDTEERHQLQEEM